MADERFVDFWARTIAARSPAMVQQLRGVALGMIAARRALRESMPGEFVHCPSLDLLFELFVADRQTASVEALSAAVPTAPSVTRRWIDVFVQRDLVRVRGDDASLTDAGFRMMADACQAVTESQTSASAIRPN